MNCLPNLHQICWSPFTLYQHQQSLKSISEEKSLKPVAELQRRSACSFNSLFTLLWRTTRVSDPKVRESTRLGSVRRCKSYACSPFAAPGRVTQRKALRRPQCIVGLISDLDTCRFQARSEGWQPKRSPRSRPSSSSSKTT